MAESSFPSPDNTYTVDDIQYEQLASSAEMDGMVDGNANSAAPCFGDGSGMVVKITGDRAAKVRGKGWKTDSVGLTVPITANSSGQVRIDLVVLRLDRTTWNITTVAKPGTPGSGVAPSPQRDTGPTGLWEFPLAEVTVADGASTILAGDVKNRAWYLSRGGAISCTQTSRPPAAVGRLFVESDTGRTWISMDGNAFKPILEDSGWIPCSINTTYWSSVGAGPEICRYNGSIYLRGTQLSRKTGLQGTTPSRVFTFPTAFSPSRTVQNNGYTSGANIANLVANTSTASGGDANSVVIGGHRTMDTGDSLYVPDMVWKPASDKYWG